MTKLKFITGGLLCLHALLRIIFIDSYVLNVHQNFETLLGMDTTLTIVASLYPFIEFFIGLSIISRKHSANILCAGMGVSFVVSAFMIFGNVYPKLVYHFVVLVLLAVLCVRHRKTTKQEFIL